LMHVEFATIINDLMVFARSPPGTTVAGEWFTPTLIPV